MNSEQRAQIGGWILILAGVFANLLGGVAVFWICMGVGGLLRGLSQGACRPTNEATEFTGFYGFMVGLYLLALAGCLIVFPGMFRVLGWFWMSVLFLLPFGKHVVAYEKALFECLGHSNGR